MIDDVFGHETWLQLRNIIYELDIAATSIYFSVLIIKGYRIKLSDAKGYMV